MDSLPEDCRLELVAINPGVVLGPILDEDYGTTGELVRKLMKRDTPGCPPIGYALADVRDVAGAHIAAMDAPQAAGKRFIVATDHVWMRDIALALDAHLKGKGYKIPTRALPAFVLRLVAIFDKTAKLAVPWINLRMDLSHEQATRILNWEPRSMETMVTDMADSFIEFKVA